MRPSESTAPPDTAALPATPDGSGRVTSSRWPTSRVDGEGQATVPAADDHGVIGALGGQAAERARAVEQRQDAVAEDEHPPAGDGADGLVGEAQRALDAVERDRVRLAAGLDEQRGHDRQRERQADLGDGAAADLGRERDLAAELADHRPHGVHADAAAGDVARDLGGREAGLEEQLRGARGVERRGGLGGDQPALDRAATDLGRVDAAPVVADVDDDVAAGVAGGDLERAGRRLARRGAVVGRLEAVVERVADEVDERVAEGLDDGAVELGVLADELELDVLAELGRQVADEAREAHEDGVDRDHPDLHDHRLQGLRGARELLHRLAQAGHVGLGGERLDERAVDDELAHAVHEGVEALGVDADGGRGLLRRGGGRGGRRPSGAGAGSGGGAPRPPGPRRAGAASSAAVAEATSGTPVTVAISAPSSWSHASHASISRPSKPSTSSWCGTDATSSPCSAIAASTMYARTDGISVSSVSVADTCTTRAPAATAAAAISAAAGTGRRLLGGRLAARGPGPGGGR